MDKVDGERKTPWLAWGLPRQAANSATLYQRENEQRPFVLCSYYNLDLTRCQDSCRELYQICYRTLFRSAKISYTESTEKAQRYTEMLKIGPYGGTDSHW